MKKLGNRSGLKAILLATVGLTLSACDGLYIFFGTDCTRDLRPSIIIVVREAATGQPAASGAEGWIREGDFFEALTGGDLELSAGQGRPGTYDVVVRKEGFQDWHATGVHVVLGLCHVETVRLKANLVATPANGGQ